MRDARRIQERVEVRLDRIQVVWLTLGGVVALGLMFALGFLVGRRAAIFSETPAAQRSDPIAEIDEAGKMHDKLTFYEKLTASQPPEQPPPRERVEPAAPPPAQAPTPAASAIAQATADDSEATPAQPSSPPARSPEPRPSDAALRGELAARPAHAGEYTIQVSAFQSMPEARAFSSALERKGFSSYVVSTRIPGKGVWYRVRLGRFASEQEATRAKSLLARSDIPAWVVKVE